MADVLDLTKERTDREYRRAIQGAIFITADLPERLPVVAPGWTVKVKDPAGTVALIHPCETSTDESAMALLPGPHERATVVAALKEALAALGNPVTDASN